MGLSDETQKLETAQPTEPIIPARVKDAMDGESSDAAGAASESAAASTGVIECTDESAAAAAAVGKKRALLAVAAVALVALVGVGLFAGGVFSAPGESVVPANGKTSVTPAEGQKADAGTAQSEKAANEVAPEAAAETAADASAEEAAAQEEAAAPSSTTTTTTTATEPASASSASSSSSGSASSGSGSSSSSSSEPAAPAPAPAPEPAMMSVSVYIDSLVAASEGYPSCLGSGTVSLPEGASAYDALKALGVRSEGSGEYVTSIGGLSEFDCGPLSGWKYSVNGSFPSSSCGNYKVKSGDSVKWIYVLQP